ncbi:hypothetical protein FD754_008675 [Muntiacus muntjak]|uniref:Ras-related GTP-binding protein n=1 Tax=Muntiacus muntjak TaxID=9888 RepID=A0A5N3WRM1_MUNMU|nr:hypothetical protein FD754_008675 [Muntiacus muntjak]
MNLPTGCGGLERQRSGLACQGTVLSLQYWAEETPLMGQYLAADSFPKDLTMSQGFCSWASGATGKSCIQKVVFHKMSPNETPFLERTIKTYKDDISNSSFVNFQIWGFPGKMDFFDSIFAYKVNLDMNFEVFIHKVDGLDIHQRANDDIADAGIYDHSIFVAFSKVLQKFFPQLLTLENLLNIFISNSGIEKAFLFDVVSKIYIATDSSPVDMQSGSAYHKESKAIIKLNNTTVLYLKEVTKFLALVYYKFHCFRKAIHAVFEVDVTSHRSCSHQTSAPNLKALTHNCTP